MRSITAHESRSDKKPPAAGRASENLLNLADHLRLVVITDDAIVERAVLLDILAGALAAGAPAVQLRSKNTTPRERLAVAARIREETQRRSALFFVNDRVDLALAAGADGVHVGPEDLPVHAVRSVGGPDMIVGFSASTPNEAREGVKQGADYIGCGSVFGTTNKPDAGRPIGPEGLAQVVAAVDVPVIAIGGVTPERAALVKESGAAGCAVIGPVMTALDVPTTVAQLLAPWGSQP